MVALGNGVVDLSVSEDGLRVEIRDLRRECTWRIDTASRTFAVVGDKALVPPRPLPGGTASHEHADRIVSEHVVEGGIVRFSWALENDHVVLTLECAGDGRRIVAASWPGWWNVDGGTAEILVPTYQGVALRANGTDWENAAFRGGHGDMSMGFTAALGDRAGLLASPDELADWRLCYGEAAGRVHSFFIATPSSVDGWRPRTIRIAPCGGTVSEAARRYRVFAIARGQWRSWAEKIREKPLLDNLFGAVMVFIGYIHDPQTDYVAGTRALRAMGFERQFVYPVRFAHYSQRFTMAGRDPIHLDDATVGALKAIDGVHVAPWAWTIEGIDDGSAAMLSLFRRNSDGELSGGWSMDNQRWQHVCTPYQIEHIRRRLDSDMKQMDWLHFDVNASHLPPACFRTDHDLHRGVPLSTAREIDEVRRLLSVSTVGNRVVSSEGFNDAYTAAYDIGSTKMLPRDEARPAAMPVPLSMLVYHDCCIQDWWEAHNYNPNPAFPLVSNFRGPQHLGRVGAGGAAAKAALDALYGLPPNVFPFGYQYGWVTKPLGDTFGYRQVLDDPHVRAALQYALPVSRLHRQVGKLEMTEFELLSEDRFVQRTTFADGTRIVANLGAADAAVDGLGMIQGHTWRRVD